MTCHFKLNDNEIKLAVIPEERIKVEFDTLTDQNGKEYSIIGRFSFMKGEPFPSGLMLIATGKEVKESDVWSTYNQSKRIYFYIIKPI